MRLEQPIVLDPNSPGGSASPYGLIVFDGVCVLCSWGCRFVDKRDRRGYFRHVPIQQAEGRAIAEQLGIDPDRPESFAFVANGRAYVKSDAVLRIARELPWWGWVSMFLLVARNRYRWFGRTEVCALPAEDRTRRG
jgi:predicted DCC family thiol-disulfide oxidoreductase YuxK